MSKQPRPTRMDCGCVHNATTWLAMCPKHEAEYNERHRQAGVDYLRMMELASGRSNPAKSTDEPK